MPYKRTVQNDQLYSVMQALYADNIDTPKCSYELFSYQLHLSIGINFKNKYYDELKQVDGENLTFLFYSLASTRVWKRLLPKGLVLKIRDNT